jgi:hypothetical protein
MKNDINYYKIDTADILHLKENYKKYGEIDTKEGILINAKLDKKNYNDEVFNFETFFCNQKNEELNKIISKYIKIENNEFIYSAHYNKYKTGDSIKKHVDSIDTNKTRTFTILLNENFEGGDFFVDGIHVPIRYGEIIEFDGTKVHWTTPIISGEREIFAILLHNFKKDKKTII